MKDRRKKAGFTLVELLVSVLAAGIMSLTIGAVLYGSWRSWADGKDAVQMQRDSTIVFRAIAQEVRSSSIDAVTAGASLTCPGGTFSRSGSALMFNDVRLADDYVTDFSSTINTNTESVTVTLRMQTDLADSTVSATFFTRN